MNISTSSAIRSTQWMKDARYGVFIHYLPNGEDWQPAIESFDVESFARQMHEAGAGYLIFTLGQNSGYFNAPNRTYETYVGCEPYTRCSKRDLPMELADTLAKYEIKLMLYLPSRSPQDDPAAMQALSDVHEQQPAPQEFTRKWSEIIEEWSLHYGPKVAGWWFDGSYNTQGWDDLSKPYSWRTWAAACRSGNPDSLLAFNPGTDVKRAFSVLTDEQDYTAGEQEIWTVTPQQVPSPDGVQWQVLAYISSWWGAATAPQIPDEAMIDYIRTITGQGGAASIDVYVSFDGLIFESHLNQLRTLKAGLKAA